MGTTSDKAVLTRKLGATDYDPARYVAEISQRCVGGEEILGQRKKIQELSDDTSTLLKQNVYQNYTQFIETAKEISHLENDMYRLSAMITEQRKFLTGLLDTSLLGDVVPLSLNLEKEEEAPVEEIEKEDPSRQEAGRARLIELMEKVEGGREIIDVPNRYLIYDGDLVEMDTTDHSAIHRVHIYLTNDCWLVATWLTEKRGPIRFKLSSQYPLSTCALVNVRDLAGVACAWKLLIPPEPRLFQCKDSQSKKEWLAAYEEARLIQKGGGSSAGGTAKSARFSTSGGGKTKPAAPPPPPAASSKKRTAADQKSAKNNPFSDTDSEVESKVDEPEQIEELPEWLQELPDTLDVHIAQREFETALEIIKDAEEDLDNRKDCKQVKDLKAVNVEKKKTLTQVLRGELLITPDKSMQGGPRTARRAVHLLTRLGRELEAKDLFLSHRTALLRHHVKDCRAEGNSVQYIQRMGSTFFHQVAETCREYDKCFPSGKTSGSPLLMWTEQEVDWFADRIDKQIFSPHAPIANVCESVSRLRGQAKRLQSLSLEVEFLLDTRLQSGIERLICEARDKAIEAVKLRWGEEKWQPFMANSKVTMDKTLSELTGCGVVSVQSYLSPEGGLELTNNTVKFSLSYLTLTDQLLQLYTPGTRHLVNESLVSVMHAHLRHLEQGVKSDKVEGAPSNFVAKNCAFLLDTVLSLVEHKYQEKTGSDIPKLGKLHSTYSWLKDGKQPSGSVSKYADNNYV